MRTSATHPIQIAEIPCQQGIIGITLCPGKKGTSLFGADWDRDLEVDLDAVEKWRATIVVSLIENFEFEHLGVEDLGQSVITRGMEWIHAPIQDVGVPNDNFETRWAVLGHRIRSALINGDRVLIHCRGGLGRAGLVAARLLVEFGLSPDAAIQQVRGQRLGAIETLEQESYVKSVRQLNHDHQIYDRILGCLFGGAVGDAFGYAIEFDSLARIQSRYGACGLLEPELENGHLIVSDDTQMTMFVADALTKDGPPLENIQKGYIDWYRTQNDTQSALEEGLLAHKALWALRAPGNTCLTAIGSGGWGTTSSPINNSKGCGGVMRVAPVGFNLSVSDAQTYELGAQSAALTHGHPLGYISSGVMAVLIRNLIASNDHLSALLKAAEHLPDDVYGTSMRSTLADAIEKLHDTINGEDNRSEISNSISNGDLGEGWVAEEALAIGLHAFMRSYDAAKFEGYEPVDAFKIGIRLSANHSGDSDSTASITGQLFGAQYGLRALPWDWIVPLDVFEALCDLAHRLVAFASPQSAHAA
ncbi:ADP-ribosylglycohydrolase family protein [Brevundimonas sp.]|uniref:ADP-ribosylglycohydrolase family protein n=1 Tax=Brevundimonas sp. TaxID=1871086 RepID=UPI0028A0A7EC|nr:ADP-ribosylglycohydrolase family protein [Brevundimonas sp.]